MIYAVKKDWETNEKLILRYKKLFFQSRILTKLKGGAYFKKKPKKRNIREAAIIRSLYRDLSNKVYF